MRPIPTISLTMFLTRSYNLSLLCYGSDNFCGGRARLRASIRFGGLLIRGGGASFAVERGPRIRLGDGVEIHSEFLNVLAAGCPNVHIHISEFGNRPHVGPAH